MIRTKGEAGTGNVVEAVRHMHNIMGEIRSPAGEDTHEIVDRARALEAPADLLAETARMGRLPVVNFSAGGIATPADAALMMQMGADGVFVGSGIFHSANPAKMAEAIVRGSAPLYRTQGYRRGKQRSRGTNAGPRHPRTPRG